MALKEYVDVEGGRLEHGYKKLSEEPSVWRCVANLNGFSADGTGRNKQEAKHAASQQMCCLLELDLE